MTVPAPPRPHSANEVRRVESSSADGLPVARSWAEIADMLAARPPKLLIIDGDNVMYRPRGYLGSEGQEWDSTALLARRMNGTPEDVRQSARTRVLKRRDADEQRMLTHRFFEVPTGIDAATRAALTGLGRTCALACVSARPAVLRPVVDRLLALTGFAAALREVQLSGGRGVAKLDLIKQVAARHGVSRSSDVAVVDDLGENLAPARAAGHRCIHFAPRLRNYEHVSAPEFLELARRATDQSSRFELLLNAYARAGARELDDVTKTIAAALAPGQRQLWQSATRGLRELVQPFALGRPLTPPS